MEDIHGKKYKRSNFDYLLSLWLFNAFFDALRSEFRDSCGVSFIIHTAFLVLFNAFNQPVATHLKKFARVSGKLSSRLLVFLQCFFYHPINIRWQNKLTCETEQRNDKSVTIRQKSIVGISTYYCVIPENQFIFFRK